MDAWLKYYKELKAELQNLLGKTSFTVDMWSSKGMQPYISITIHWLGPKEDQVLLRQALLAFRRVHGAHSVAFIRKSGQRRDELLGIIEQGNTGELWREFNAAGNAEVVSLAAVTVLRNVKTRWDSVFYMLRRLRYLRQPITRFFALNRDAQTFSHPLGIEDWNRLEILELILQQPHTIQTIMSSENTPILAGTVPAFELFISAWEAMKADPDPAQENVASIISPGLTIAKNYYKKLEESNAYIIAMFINPCIRMEWIKKNWLPTDQVKARKIILDKLESYWDQQDITANLRASSPGSQGSRNSSRTRGPAVPAMLTSTANKYRNVKQALDLSSGPASGPGATWTVEQEMDSYIQSLISPPQTTDMIGYWMNHGKTAWPTIYQLFTDYAAIQSTSVPSERMLKFNFKKSRLNFMAEWQSPPIPPEDEDWLRQLAATDENDRDAAVAAIRELFNTADNIQMLEEDIGM
ncbi:ribonuclease H-like domain-containing protein [Mycena rosella]|uniref:Ribonuclease H-like domain-containing protein n=1 Tax=Mycena rosella TaxID=1033263 RepID=A0AAD7BJL0_MYCRO|nr:ribonuclease H-like domain-containing protein [Mycena rosella]